MKKRSKPEIVFTIFSLLSALLFISSILLDIFDVIRADKMIQGFILAFMLVSIGIASFKSNKVLGIACFVVSVFTIIGSTRYYNVFTWYNF